MTTEQIKALDTLRNGVERVAELQTELGEITAKVYAAMDTLEHHGHYIADYPFSMASGQMGRGLEQLRIFTNRHLNRQKQK